MVSKTLLKCLPLNKYVGRGLWSCDVRGEGFLIKERDIP